MTSEHHETISNSIQNLTTGIEKAVSMDPYSTCFCGSGEKYKFCCQKAESLIYKIEKLLEDQKWDSALTAVNDAIRKFPDAAMLVLQKSVLESRNADFSGARRTLESYLAKNKKHVGALAQLILVILELNGPSAAALELQRVIKDLGDADLTNMSRIPAAIADRFAEMDLPVAALGHQRLALAWSAQKEEMTRNLVELASDPDVSLFLRQITPFKPCPADAPEEQAEKFKKAIALANRGLWHEAISAFEAITDKSVIVPATFNRGLMLAYLGENPAAVACLRSIMGSLGQTDEAVDLEAFCQELSKLTETGTEDTIMLTWPIRSREQIEESLEKSRQFVNITASEQIQQSEDFDSSRSYYMMLSKPQVTNPSELTLETVTNAIGTVVVEDRNVMLTAVDNGQLDQWAEQLRDIAGSAIVPAHPRTKHVHKKAMDGIFTEPSWVLPSETPENIQSALRTAYIENIAEKVIPQRTVKCLGNLTAGQYAQSDHSKVPLRAFLRLFDQLAKNPEQEAVINRLREQFRLPVESVSDDAPVSEIHVSRLKYVDLTKRNLEELEKFCRIAANYRLTDLSEKGLTEIISRQGETDSELSTVKQAYIELAFMTASKEGLQAGLDLLKKGQSIDPQGQSESGILEWQLFALRMRSALDSPESWVADLAIMLDQNKSHQENMSQIFRMLVSIGLIRPVQDPNRPGGIALDSSLLDFLLDKFGPKIATPSGGLGVSAGKPQIWTPGSEAGRSGSKIWQPGQGESSGGKDKPDSGSKLIIPGR
ncbi:MAG: hypothetical protein RJA81_2317 [Planctomycetota bacterium]